MYFKQHIPLLALEGMNSLKLTAILLFQLHFSLITGDKAPNMEQSVTLSSGYKMPIVGLGLWQLSDKEAENAVTTALEIGYRHIDGAFLYENEEAVGKSLKKWFDKGNKREDLFITSKVPNFGNHAADVEMYLNYSLKWLGLDYVDMYMLHAPFGTQKDETKMKWAIDKDGEVVLDYDIDHKSLWKAMEDQVKKGRVKSIGLSNFNETQIQNILNFSEIKPSNLQNEIQAYNPQKPLREFCKKNNIAVTAFSTLGSMGTSKAVKTASNMALPSLLEHPVVQAIAKSHQKTTAQILLRHQVQGGLIVIPKSGKPKRIAENFDIFDFELSANEMQKLDELDKGEEGRIFAFTGWYSKVASHPQYPF